MRVPRRCRVNPGKKGFFNLPAVILAFSVLAGSVGGKLVLPETGRWLPLTFPVFGLIAVIAPSPAALAAVGMAGGVLLENLRSDSKNDGKVLEGMEVTLEGTVIRTSPLRFGKAEMKFYARDILWLKRTPFRARMRIRISGEDAPPPGAKVRIRAGMDENPGGSLNAGCARGEAIKGSVKVDPPLLSFTRKGVKRLSEALDRSHHQAAGLLGAISMGQRWRVTDPIRNLFRRTGIYHLLAISGVHLAAALFPGILLIRFWTIWAGKDRVGLRSLLIPLFGTATLWVYLSLAGLSTSAFRAAVFLFLLWSCGVFKRLQDSISVLGWCVVFIVLVSSRHQPDVALLLSAGAVLGILSGLDQRCGYFGKALGAAMGALLFTLPISVWLSRGIPLFSPVCNVTAGAFFGVALIPLAVLIVLAACFTPLPMEPLSHAWCLMADPVIQALGHISSMDNSFLILSGGGCFAAALCGLVSLFVWKKHRYGLVPGLVLFLGIALFAGMVEQALSIFLPARAIVCFPRVGQADAAILRSGRSTILIDTAGPPTPGHVSPVVAALLRMGARKVDAVFLTHAHPDHIGGFYDIAGRWKIKTLYLPEIEKNPGRWSSIIKALPSDAEVVSLSMGEKIQIGNFLIKVLGPPCEWTESRGENEGSLQLHVQGNGLSAFFTGDASWDQVVEVMGHIKDLNLMKIPHHGSREGFPPPGLEGHVKRFSKEGQMIALFPAPPPRDGSPLPAREVVDWFKAEGIPCYFSGEGKGTSFKVKDCRAVERDGAALDPLPALVPIVDIPCPF